MSNFQYVFGNPIAGKKKKQRKKLAKASIKHKLGNKRKVKMAKKKKRSSKKPRSAKQRANDKRLGLMAKARHKSIKKVTHKRKKRKNPVFIGSKGGEAKKSSVHYIGGPELHGYRSHAKRLEAHAKASGNKKAIKRAKAARSALKIQSKNRKAAIKRAKLMKREGLDVTKLEGTQAEVAAKLRNLGMAKRKKAKKSKKTGKKRSAAQKRATKKMLAANKAKRGSGKKRKTRKKRAKKIHVTRKARRSSKPRRARRTRRIGKSRKLSMKALRSHKKNKTHSYHIGKGKKHKRYSVKRTNPYRRRNPMNVNFNQLAGQSMQEVGALVGGGLAYGAVNSLMSKIPGIKTLNAQLVKIPVIGTSLPTLLLGVLCNYIGDKKNIKYLKMAGTGLVGASVVGIGVNLSQFVPGLKPAALAGVQFSRGFNGVQYSPGFNGIPSGMNGVQYSPGFSGSSQLGHSNQLGVVGQSGSNSADFGNVGSADFGNMPSGMGYDSQDDDYEDEGDEGSDFEGIPSGMN